MLKKVPLTTIIHVYCKRISSIKTLVRLVPLICVFGFSEVEAQDYITPPMVNIPAGEFMMGGEGGDPAITPIHAVSVPAFQMGKYAVTIAEFRKFAIDTGYDPESTCNDFIDKDGLKGPEFLGSGRWNKHRYSFSDFQPVTCISWKDANAYAQWLSDKTGIQYHLPTEEEWEYAAKANTTSRYFWGDDPAQTQAYRYGNFADHTSEYFNTKEYALSNIGFIGNTNGDDGESRTTIVGLYRPNPFGLYDIAGNVAQYLASCYYPDGYKERSEDELDPNGCEFIATRGGTWHYPAQPTSTRGRFKREGWNVDASIGFRLAVDGHNEKTDLTTIQFEEALKKAIESRLATRPQLPLPPKNLQLVKVKDNTYRLSWQPSNDPNLSGYEVYRSKFPQAHFFGGFYQNQYELVQTLSAQKSAVEVTLPKEGGSFRVVTVTKELTSLPSNAAVDLESQTVSIPGRITMQKALALENVSLTSSKDENGLPELFYLFKTNRNFDQKLVTTTFNIAVEKSAWYTLNYRGRTFQTGLFFRLWQNNALVAEINYDRNIDDQTSDRHKVFLEKGTHQLQFSVSRDGFDRWSMVWLDFAEIKP